MAGDDDTREESDPTGEARRLLSDDQGLADPRKTRGVIEALLGQLHKQRVLVDLGRLTTSEFNLVRLLEIIVSKSSAVVDADRSTLFLVDAKTDQLWTIVAEGLQAEDSILTMPMGSGIVGHVAVSGEQVIIDDVYRDRRFDRTIDQKTGYRTRNLVATPLVGSRGAILGVLEVMNKKSGVFSVDDADFLMAFASSAAAHVEAANLHNEIQHLFDSFIDVVAHAVDERDPCTAGHSRRVKVYSRCIAEEINRVDQGPLGTFSFTQDDLRQLEIAALLHDVGKIGVRESVLNKRNRLTDEALKVIIQRLDLELSHQLLERVKTGEALDPDVEREVKLAIEFITRVSSAGALSKEEARRLWEIRARGWLEDCEYEHLAVARGNLTKAEWEIMQTHVSKSHQILARIPWPTKLQRVPDIAYCHHEKLNGKGYPRGLAQDAIPFESQIVTVADIYDALTAHDRPYKPPMPHERAADLLIEQAQENYLNRDVVELFLRRELYRGVR